MLVFIYRYTIDGSIVPNEVYDYRVGSKLSQIFPLENIFCLKILCKKREGRSKRSFANTGYFTDSRNK